MEDARFDELHALLGRRYVTDFTVVAISGDDEGPKLVRLRRYGEEYVITLAELRTAIDTRFIVEAGKES